MNNFEYPHAGDYPHIKYGDPEYFTIMMLDISLQGDVLKEHNTH